MLTVRILQIIQFLQVMIHFDKISKIYFIICFNTSINLQLKLNLANILCKFPSQQYLIAIGLYASGDTIRGERMPLDRVSDQQGDYFTFMERWLSGTVVDT